MIKNLSKLIDTEVEVSGVVDKIRNTKWVIFLIVRDSTGKVQVTIEKNEKEDLVEKIENLTCESTVRIRGSLVFNAGVKLNGYELIPNQIEITSVSEPELPINIHNKEAQNLDQRLDYRWLDLRNDINTLMMKIQSDFVKYLREYLYNCEFVEFHSPKLIPTASESGSEVFEVRYFDDKAYLAQSPQFYKQMAISSGLDRVFEIGPVFRAENSNTNRHATEFTGFDVEFSYINSYEDVMNLEEELLIYALKKLKDKYNDKMKELFQTEIIVPTSKFPRIRLEDLYNELEKRYNYIVPQDEKGDMTTEAEKLAYKYSMEKFGSEFLFITDFSKEKRAFYHMRKDGVPQGYDLIWKGVEITTGAQREHRYDKLKKQANEKGLERDVQFYLDFFKYGCPPHGGFGLGVDRITMLLLNLPNLKESMFIYRGPTRLKP